MNRYEISTLRAYYGNLLTEKQNEMLRLRYDEDMSFGEIAETFSVSRQAVLDAVKSGEKALADYETKLGLISLETSLVDKINTALSNLDNGDTEGAKQALRMAKESLE